MTLHQTSPVRRANAMYLDVLVVTVYRKDINDGVYTHCITLTIAVWHIS